MNDMNESDSQSRGWMGSFRRLTDSLLALISNRIELFAVELQEEKLRFFNLLVWVCLAMILGMAGFLVGLAALSLWLWNTTGYAGLIGLALLTLALAAGIMFGIRRQIRASPPPFAETMAEFKKDAECLRKN